MDADIGWLRHIPNHCPKYSNMTQTQTSKLEEQA